MQSFAVHMVVLAITFVAAAVGSASSSQSSASSIPVPHELSSATAPRPVEQSDASRSQERLDKLEASFALVRDYNDDFLSIVVWAFGSLIAMTLVLLGFNWFQSNRVLKRDFDSLKQELSATLAGMAQKESSRFEETRTKESARIDKKLDEASKAVRSISLSVVEESTSPIYEALDELKDRILLLEIEAAEAKIKMWLDEDVPINAVRACGVLIDASIKYEGEWRIARSLEMFGDALTLAEKDGSKMDVRSVSELETILARVPAALKTARDAALVRLSKIRKL